MQHSIDESRIGKHANIITSAIETCVHCGFCLSACPTYRVLGEEMDSPRGRIYLMKSALEGQILPEQAQPFIDRCLGCVACVPACPSGVQYGELLTSYRAHTEDRRKRSFIDSVARKLICETLPYPSRFRMAAQTGQLGRYLQPALPDKIGAMLGLIPRKIPPKQSLPEIVPAIGKRRARVALVSGCVQQVLAPNINSATVTVLAHNGVETVIPKEQGCCGSIMMHIGEFGRAQSLARHNIELFPDDVDAIITNAAGCGSGMHEYDLLFHGSVFADEAHDFASKVSDITTFLDSLGIFPPKGFKEPVRVAYHDPCHLLHAQGIKDAPRRLLQTIPNLALVEIDDGGLCCGSAGTYNIEQPQIAYDLGERKAQHILDKQVDMVATGNIGCMTQIQTHLKRKNCSATILHTVEILQHAYSGQIEAL